MGQVFTSVDFLLLALIGRLRKTTSFALSALHPNITTMTGNCQTAKSHLNPIPLPTHRSSSVRIYQILFPGLPGDSGPSSITQNWIDPSLVFAPISILAEIDEKLGGIFCEVNKNSSDHIRIHANCIEVGLDSKPLLRFGFKGRLDNVDYFLD